MARVNVSEVTQPHITVQELNDDLLVNVLWVTILIGIEAVIGFFGNILILCVYSKWYVHCNFRYFVLYLSVYDFTSCLTTLPGEMYSQFYWYEYKYDWICRIKSYFNVFTAWGSAFTLLLLAFDRHRKICRPLARQIQPSLALKLCVSGIFLASCVSSPILVLWGKQTYTVNGINLNVSICEKSGQYANEKYPFIYVCVVYILLIGTMMIAIFVWNVLIARKLFCKMSERGLTRNNGNTLKRNISEGTSILIFAGVSRGIRRTFSCAASVTLTDIYRKPASEVHISQQNSDVSLSSISFQTETTGRRHSSTFDFLQRTDTIYLRHRTSDIVDAVDTRPDRSPLRWKRKTLIMIVLTSVFIITMSIYIALITLVAETDNILREISNSEKVVYFFFWRMYFINCVINPILYGVMDPRFRKGLKQLFCSCKINIHR